MKKSAKRSIIVSAVLAIIMCVSLAAGATFALFTSESKVNITVSSGKVNVVATPSNLQTYSGENLTGNKDDDVVKLTTELGGTNGTFINGGTAAFNSEDANTLELTNMTPGDKVTFDITVENNSNVAIKYRTIIMCKEDNGLFDGLEIDFKDGETTATGTTVTDDNSSAGEATGEAAEEATEETNKAQDVLGMTVISKWASLAPKTDFDLNIVHVTIDLPSDRDNKYQEKNCTISYVVEAVQGNTATDMPADTLYLYTAYDMYAFAKFYNAQEKDDNETFMTEYETFKLMADVDLSGKEWTPIRGLKNDGFRKTFDGNGKTISGLKIDTTEDKVGLFGSLKSGATVKNVNLEGEKITSTASYVGGIAGVSYYGSFIENCTIDDTSYIKGQDNVGGFVGSMTSINYNYRTSHLTDCTNYATVEVTHKSADANDTQHAGGLVGMVTTCEKIEFIRCKNYGKVLANGGSAGGILGFAMQGVGITINECRNECSLDDFNGKNKGNLIGWIGENFKEKKISIINCTIDANSIGAVSGGHSYTIIVGSGETTEEKIADASQDTSYHVAFSACWWGKDTTG